MSNVFFWNQTPTNFCIDLVSYDFFLNRKTLKRENSWRRKRILVNTSIQFEKRGKKTRRRRKTTKIKFRVDPSPTEALSSGMSVAHRCNSPLLLYSSSVSVSERKTRKLRHKIYLFHYKGNFKKQFYICQRSKREAPAILLYLLFLFFYLSKPKLTRNGQYPALLMVTVTTFVPYSLQVRTYWLELQSSAREKHPDTKEPIGTCVTVSL